MRELSSYLEKLFNFHLNLCINHDYIKPLVFQLSFLFFAVSNWFISSNGGVLVLSMFFLALQSPFPSLLFYYLIISSFNSWSYFERVWQEWEEMEMIAWKSNGGVGRILLFCYFLGIEMTCACLSKGEETKGKEILQLRKVRSQS